MNAPADRLPFCLRKLINFKTIMRQEHGIDDQTMITALMVDCATFARSQGLTRDQFIDALEQVWDTAAEAELTTRRPKGIA